MNNDNCYFLLIQHSYANELFGYDKHDDLPITNCDFPVRVPNLVCKILSWQLSGTDRRG